ncbi:LysE family translocator, partial [Vibrio parahaemolyticus]|nr:LysE family translocator [Vibrio parahaemolyticus]MDF5034053.1 LysE family translocator [Vibrio parahaemolyticus]MDF5361322.1 LysE family translocator [Vibrio parahaemolyticus]
MRRLQYCVAHPLTERYATARKYGEKEMDLNSLLLFIVACLAINMIPGPDVIYIVSNT